MSKNNYHKEVKLEFLTLDTLNIVNSYEKNGAILIATSEKSFEDMLNTFLFTLQEQIVQYYNDGNLSTYLEDTQSEMIVSNNTLLAIELSSYHGIKIFIDFTHDNVLLVAKYKLDHLKILPLVKGIQYLIQGNIPL